MKNSKTILIIDDEQSLRGAVADLFKKSGFNVLEADNGELGLQMVAVDAPDAIVLDLKMPIVGGIEVLRRLRIQSDDKYSPYILILTNQDGIEDMAKAVELGVFDYFIKTDRSLDEIVERVRANL